MKPADKDIREHIDAVIGWKNRPDNAFDVRLAFYANQLEREVLKLRAIINGKEFDSLTGNLRDGAPTWLRKLANDLRAGDTLYRNTETDARMLDIIAVSMEGSPNV